MQTASCPHCGTRLKVRPEYAGKQVACGTCKARFVLPLSEAEVVVLSVAEPEPVGRRLRPRHLCIAAGTVAFLGLVASAAFLTRDTWERDNAAQLAALEAEAAGALQEGDPEKACTLCDIILGLIGNRTLQKPESQSTREYAVKTKEQATAATAERRARDEEERPKHVESLERAETAAKALEAETAQMIAAERAKAEAANRRKEAAEAALRAAKERTKAEAAARQAAERELAALKGDLERLRRKP